MVIVIFVTAWVVFSTIICLAFARVAARRRPQVNDNVPLVAEKVSAVGDTAKVEIEAPRRQTRNAELTVCATP